MKKDKEWLKKKIKGFQEGENMFTSEFNAGVQQSLEYAQELIDQLDEPEQTEQSPTQSMIEQVLEVFFTVVTELDERESPLTFKEFVYQSLEKLDEPEKPVIPKFVADLIEEERAQIIDWHTEIPERFFLILGHKLNYTTLANTNASDWIFSGNEEKLYQALKYGYEVEKEKLYHVVNKENYFLLRKYDGLVDILHALTSMSRDKYGKDTRFMLTEQEIKDYDERFWVFAEEITE